MKWKIALTLYTAFIATVFILAYIGLIPNKLNGIPYYDSVGHFALYGLWGFFLAKVFNKSILSIAKLQVQLGILLIIPFAIAEEFLQLLFPIRSFSFFDMGWGIAGIITACIIINQANLRSANTDI